jgi:hypothetical protein
MHERLEEGFVNLVWVLLYKKKVDGGKIPISEFFLAKFSNLQQNPNPRTPSLRGRPPLPDYVFLKN